MTRIWYDKIYENIGDVFKTKLNMKKNIIEKGDFISNWQSNV